MSETYTLYSYAMDVIEGRWIEAEHKILERPNSYWSLRYLRSFPEAMTVEIENLILRDCENGYRYARIALKGRFPAFEKRIYDVKNLNILHSYMENFSGI